MKQKDQAQQLGDMMNSLGGFHVTNTEEVLPTELTQADPLFDIQYEAELNKSQQKAKNSIKSMVNSIVPKEFQNDQLIKDKVRQDAIQLGQLYYQQDMNNMVLKTTMEAISKGDNSPRMFEAYDKIANRAQALTKQINEYENAVRKYYIDTYLDLKSKMNYDEEVEEYEQPRQQNVLIGNQPQRQLENMQEEKTVAEEGFRVTSTKQTAGMLMDYKMQMYKQKMQEAETINKNDEI